MVFSESRLAWVREMLAAANSSERERELLALVVGQLYGWAAEQTPVGNDKAGNFADGGMPGQMDCIDHSTTTTRLLHMIEDRGWLRFHRVLEPVRRSILIFAALQRVDRGPRRRHQRGPQRRRETHLGGRQLVCRQRQAGMDRAARQMGKR